MQSCVIVALGKSRAINGLVILSAWSHSWVINHQCAGPQAIFFKICVERKHEWWSPMSKIRVTWDKWHFSSLVKSAPKFPFQDCYYLCCKEGATLPLCSVRRKDASSPSRISMQLYVKSMSPGRQLPTLGAIPIISIFSYHLQSSNIDWYPWLQLSAVWMPSHFLWPGCSTGVTPMCVLQTSCSISQSFTCGVMDSCC